MYLWLLFVELFLFTSPTFQLKQQLQKEKQWRMSAENLNNELENENREVILFSQIICPVISVCIFYINADYLIRPRWSSYETWDTGNEPEMLVKTYLLKYHISYVGRLGS